jgi:hypothetical protein
MQTKGMEWEMEMGGGMWMVSFGTWELKVFEQLKVWTS